MTNEKDFFERVWEATSRIPRGRVTTYGHIAEFLGVKSAARTVGWALGAAKGSGLPAHRVVNRFGALSGRLRFEGPSVMEERLRSEGVTFDEHGNVNLDAHLWVPTVEKRRGGGRREEGGPSAGRLHRGRPRSRDRR